nr:MAG TPA: hypothetical protein [Caudoviricetes sp.]
MILKRIYFYIFKSNCTYKQQKKTAHLGGFVGFVLFLGLAGVKKAV